MLLITTLSTALLVGIVTDVKDGDTFVLSLTSEHETIRLWGIDAPEKSQPGGADARRVLRDMIKHETLACKGLYRDDYDRLIATCTINGRDLGALLVQIGYAMDYPRYSKGHYAQMQAKAKSQKRGLWSGDFRKPWQWRKEQRTHLKSR